MKAAQKILEIEALSENLSKRGVENGLLRLKVLYFISQYENLSVSMIIEKLGIKKSNFALLTAQLQKENKVTVHQAEIDKRCRTLTLTDLGKAELDAYLEGLDSFFTATPVEFDDSLDILLKYLNKII